MWVAWRAGAAKYGTAGAKDYYQHRVPKEWLTTYLVCEDCGAEYDEDRDDARTAVGSAPSSSTPPGLRSRFWSYRGLRPVLARPRRHPPF